MTRISDLCRLLTQDFSADHAKLLLVGEADVYRRVLHQNPALDERLIEVNLGAFPSIQDSWRFLTRGFEAMGLSHPAKLAREQDQISACIRAVYDAADGLPKSLNRLGQDIVLKVKVGESVVTAQNIKDAADKMTEMHWIQFGKDFPRVLEFLHVSQIGVFVVKALYEAGISRIHRIPEIAKTVGEFSRRAGISSTQETVEEAISGLVAVDFLARTGRKGEIIFAKHPAAAHTLGVIMRDQAQRFPTLADLLDRFEHLRAAIAPQSNGDNSAPSDPILPPAPPPKKASTQKLPLPQTALSTQEDPSRKERTRSQVFISYSHKDGRWLAELQTMLRPLVHDGVIDVWDDTRIKPGAAWKCEIERALASAKVAVLLVSANFLASDFIAKHELPPLLQAAQHDGATIFWIYVSSCLYAQTEIAAYQAAHNPKRPRDRLSRANRRAVLSEICARINSQIGSG